MNPFNFYRIFQYLIEKIIAITKIKMSYTKKERKINEHDFSFQ